MTDKTSAGSSKDDLTDEDAANIGRALMERLPSGYHWSDCPTEIVTDLSNQVYDLKAGVAEACEYLRRGAALVAMAGDQHMALSMHRHAERILAGIPSETREHLHWCAIRIGKGCNCHADAIERRLSEKAFVQLCAPHGKDWLTCPECAKAAVKCAHDRQRLIDLGHRHCPNCREAL